MQTPVKTFALALLAGLSAFTALRAADEVVVAPATVATPQDKSVGISSRDGISISGTDVLVTRNGLSEKLTKEITLDSGVKILPDGTVVGTDGTKIGLRPGQLITFDGKLINPPVVERVVTPGVVTTPAK